MKDLLIVVPYRNREEHLKGFLENSPAYFNKTGLTYDILICELDQVGDWNAGLSVNALIDFVNEERQYRWLYIHHVDIWPIEGEWKFPEEREVFFNMGDYGSCLMKLQTFLQVDGYSNNFWGWGGEDNELYQKLREDGYKVIDYTTKQFVEYNTTFQNHPRKFNGKNYANAIKQSMIIPRSKRTNIKDFSQHAFTKDLIELQPNVFKHIVCPKQKSPNETVNKNLILTYVTDTTDFNKYVAFVKSAQLHAAYEFDMAAIIGTANKDCWCVNQLETFGVRCIFLEDLTLAKHQCFKQFLETDQNYQFILTVPIEDLYFQLNPFEYLNKECLTIVSVEEQIFAGPKKEFINCCEQLQNKTSIQDANLDNNFYLNLRLTPNANIQRNRLVVNKAQEKYAVVSNYSCHPSLKETVDNHFKTYYFPL